MIYFKHTVLKEIAEKRIPDVRSTKILRVFFLSFRVLVVFFG